MIKAKAVDRIAGIVTLSMVIRPLRDSILKSVLSFILVGSLIICACDQIPSVTNGPVQPSNLVAIAVSSSQIDLTWQDKSDSEYGFKIERKAGTGGNWNQIATVGANVSVYSNTGLAEGATYYYKVRAYNATGESEYSNEACAINVPLFKQFDNQWGSNQLGTCTKQCESICGAADLPGICIETIHCAGCAMTSVAMILKYYGVNTDPGDLNTWLTSYSGYDDGCLINWDIAANRSDSSVEWAGKYTTVPGDWGTYTTNLSIQIQWEIDHGYPCVGGLDGHFIVITGYSDSLYSIHDPGFNRTTLGHSNITRIYTYHGVASSPGGSLGEALDNTALIWSTGGDPTEWFPQTATYYYGGDAAQSGDITHYKSTWMQTTVTGPGMLTFYWKVSSEPVDYWGGGDYLRFYVNGTEQTRICGSVDWEQKSYSLTGGTYTLRWEYTKDGDTDSGSDCGWVDKVTFTPSG